MIGSMVIASESRNVVLYKWYQEFSLASSAFRQYIESVFDDDSLLGVHTTVGSRLSVAFEGFFFAEHLG